MRIVELVGRRAPSGSVVADYMCGTGWLLSEIAAARGDLRLLGCDASPAYVNFARRQSSSATISCCDVFEFRPSSNIDLAVCTGGLHHLKESLQQELLATIYSQLGPNGVFLLGEEVIRPHSSPDDRSRALASLHRAIRMHFERVHAPVFVRDAAEDVFLADHYERGEYKRTEAELRVLLRGQFHVEGSIRVWPKSPAEYGDMIIICHKKPFARCDLLSSVTTP